MELRLADGSRVPLARTRARGCYAAAAPLAGATAVTIAGRVGGKALALRLALPEDSRPAAELVSRARRATAALASVKERLVIRPSLERPAIVVTTTYSGNTMRTVSGGEVDRRIDPEWRTYFIWMAPGIPLRMPAQTGWARQGRKRLAVIGAALSFLAWVTLHVDPATGRVHRLRMLAQGRFMTLTFSGFRASPPRTARATRTGSGA